MERAIWFLILLFSFEPPYFRENIYVDKVYVLGRLAMVYFLLLILITRWKRYCPGKAVMGILLTESCSFISTFYNGGYSLKSLGMNEIILLSFVIFLDYMFETDVSVALSVLTLHYEILVYMNFLTVFLFPQGLYNQGPGRDYWFLGQVNQTVLYIIPAILLELLYSRYVRNKRTPGIRAWGMILAGSITLLRVWSATALVGMLIFGGLICWGLFYRRAVKVNVGAELSIVTFLAFVVFRLQNYFSFFIVNVLHRNLSFSTRTEIWDSAFGYISKKLLLGYGMESIEQATERFGYMTPHNRYLYLCYQGGIVMLIMFFLFLAGGNRILRKAEKTKAAVYISACVCAFLVMMQFESYNTPLFYVPFILMFHAEKFSESRKEQSQNEKRTDIADQKLHI